MDHSIEVAVIKHLTEFISKEFENLSTPEKIEMAMHIRRNEAIHIRNNELVKACAKELKEVNKYLSSLCEIIHNSYIFREDQVRSQVCELEEEFIPMASTSTKEDAPKDPEDKKEPTKLDDSDLPF